MNDIGQQRQQDQHEHIWIVFSTALDVGALMLECSTCHRFGTVDDPTQAEWSAAWLAPSHPYPWLEGERVTIHERIIK